MSIWRASVGGLRRLGIVLLLPGVVLGGGGLPGSLGPGRYDVETFDSQSVEDAASQRKTVSLHFFGKAHPVVLEPSDLRSHRFREQAGTLDDLRTVYSAPSRSFKGHIAGEPESVVRLTRTRDGLRGYVKSSDGWAFIEPLPASGVQRAGLKTVSQEHKVYTEGDIDASFLGTCAAELAPGAGAHGETSVERTGGAVTAPEELRVLELAVDADVEFYNAYGEDSTAEIEATLNMVDGIFEAELGITIDLVSVNVWQAEPDPYTSTESGTQLNEVRSYWNNNNSAVTRDAVHLFTGKDLDGSTVGIAYVSVVCSTSVAYALSQDLGSDILMPLLVAHELGHNLGANHDPSGSSPRYIMYPSLGFTNLDEYSDQSEDDIADYIDGVSCLELEGGGSNVSDPPSGGGGGGGGGGGPVDPVLLVGLAALWGLRRSLRTPAETHAPS